MSNPKNKDGKTRMAGSDDFKKGLAQASDKQARAELASDPERLGPLAAAAREKFGLDGFSDKEIAMATKGTNFGDKDYLRLETNKRIRSEIGNDPERLAERLKAVDRDAFDFDGYTDKEINMAFRGGNFGEKDYARLIGEDDFQLTPDDPSMDDPNPGNDIGNGPGSERPGSVFRPLPVIETPINDDAPIFGGDGFSARDINANIGKRGDMITTIGDGNTFGDGASIGNDSSVTVGSQMFGTALSLPRRRMAERGGFAGLRFN